MRVPGPFGYNEEVEIRVEFSLPITADAVAETTDDLVPALSVVVGSTSTAKTTTYLTADAVYTTVESLSVANDTSSSMGNSSSYNDTSAFFKYIVAADDESTDLR